MGDSGEWGGLARYVFYVSEPINDFRDFSAINCWIDDSYTERNVMTINDSVAVVTMDVSNLQVGTHALYIEGISSQGVVRLQTSYEFFLDELPKLPKPVFRREGDVVTITPAEDSASEDSLDVNPTYYYTLDGSEPDSTAIKYEGPFELSRNGVVKAIGYQKGFRDSEVDSLLVDWFKVESVVFEQHDDYLTMTSPTEGATIFYSMTNKESHVTQTPSEPVGNGYTLHMSYECTVEAYAMKDGWENSDTLRFVYEWALADYDFDGLTLRVSGKGKVAPVLSRVDSTAAETLAAIVWESSTPLTADLLQGCDNTNLLVYVAADSLAPAGVQNVVVNGVAKNIVLTDTKSGNGNFYVPQTFMAESISYSRNFQQTTQIGVSRGWETIALPFTVQRVTHESQGDIVPFGSTQEGKHFWLRRLEQNGLQQATKIEANEPYLISMPNSEEYKADYNLGGRVTFVAEEVTVPATTQPLLSLGDGSIVMVPTTVAVGRSSAVWALNVGQVRDANVEGSVFEREYREVRPFEAYIVHRSNGGSDEDNPSPRLIPILKLSGQDVTGIQQVDVVQDAADSWWTLDGRKLQGKPARKGLYIRNGQKQVVR